MYVFSRIADMSLLEPIINPNIEEMGSYLAQWCNVGLVSFMSRFQASLDSLGLLWEFSLGKTPQGPSLALVNQGN